MKFLIPFLFSLTSSFASFELGIPYFDQIPPALREVVVPELLSLLEACTCDEEAQSAVRTHLSMYEIHVGVSNYDDNVMLGDLENPLSPTFPVQISRQYLTEDQRRSLKHEDRIIGDYAEDDYMPDHHEFSEEEDYENEHEREIDGIFDRDFGNIQHPQQLAPAGVPDENGIEPVRDLRHFVPALSPQEVRLNGLSTDRRNPLEHPELFEKCLTSISDFYRIFEALFLDNAANNIEIDQLIRIATASIRLQMFPEFQYLSSYIQWESVGGPRYKEFLEAITETEVNPIYLGAFLEKCTPVIAENVGHYMTPLTILFHQTFVDKCGHHIPKAVGKRILDCQCAKIPEELRQYWEKIVSMRNSMSNELFHIETINLLGEASGEEIVNYGDANCQIVCLFSGEPRPIEWSQFSGNVVRLRRQCEALSKVAEMQVRFAVLYLDKETNMVTIMKSPNPIGPAFSIFHRLEEDEDESIKFFLVSEEIEGLYMSPYVANEGLRVVEEYILPGDVIIGMPQSVSHFNGQGFKSGLMDMFSLLDCDDNVDSVVRSLTLMPVVKEFKNRIDLVIAAVPKPEFSDEAPAAAEDGEQKCVNDYYDDYYDNDDGELAEYD